MREDHETREDYDTGYVDTGYMRPHVYTMSPALALILLIAGLAMFVIAQFPSETEGEPPAAWDWIRHAVCFLGGALACLGIVRGFNVWRRIGSGAAVFNVVGGIILTLFAHLVIEEYFDEGFSVAGLVPVWIIQHALIAVGGMAVYVGTNRLYEAGQRW